MYTICRFPRVASGVVVACLAFAAHGSTNVFNDAVFWFRGGKDLNGDGYMQQGEFFDDLHADDDENDNHDMPMSSSGYTGDSAGYKINAKFEEEQISFPALGTAIIEPMRFLRISNVKGNNKYFPFDVNPHSIFQCNNISNEYTIVSRMRLDYGGNYNKCFVKVGYDASNKQGMWLGFAPSYPDYPGCMRVAAYRTPDSGSNDGGVYFNLPVPTNTWVDLAVVVGNGKLRVGVAAPASLSSHNNNPTIAFGQTSMWTDNCKLLGSDHYRLFCRDGQTESADGNHADTSCFLGSVQQLAIWGRALSDKEVMAAFGMPRPAIFRTGFDNGASTEFGGTRSGTTQTIDGLGSWQNVANTMKAGDAWTVNFTALRDEVGLPQIFSMKSLDGSSALIEPVLNGTSLGEGRIAANSRAFWPVPAGIVREGANALVIKRNGGGSRDFLVDAMELGGSLGVGKEDNSISDGRTVPARTATGIPSAADPNTQHWPESLQPYTNTSVTNLHLRVWVDPELADKASFTFRTKVQSANGPDKAKTGSEKFSVYVNKVHKIDCTSKVSANGLEWNPTYQPGELQGGWNDFEFVSVQCDTCQWLFDYFRFEAVLPSPVGFLTLPGLSVIIR